MLEVVNRFGTSAQRIRLLRGLLSLRAALIAGGKQEVISWICGSFVEDLKVREPNDIDVVSFVVGPQIDPAKLPAGVALRDLVKPGSVAKFGCDSFIIELERNTPVESYQLVSMTHYWYGLFGHRRTSYEWKGFVEVRYVPKDEADAAAQLDVLQNSLTGAGGGMP